MLAKSEKYELDTMIISNTGDVSTALVGGNNFLRLLSLLGMHNVTVGLSRPESYASTGMERVGFPDKLNRDADMLAGVIEDLPYYPMQVNGLNGSANYGVDAYDLSLEQARPGVHRGHLRARQQRLVERPANVNKVLQGGARPWRDDCPYDWNPDGLEQFAAQRCEQQNKPNQGTDG